MGKLKFIPVKDKIPQVQAWQTSTEEFEITGDRGLCTGLLSDNLEVLDFDLKYELIKGVLMPAYKEMVLSYDQDILKKLTVQKTANGGYHFMYRCSEIEGNQKLASRPTTYEEKLSNPNSKSVVLIETRGLLGQVVVAPTPGYEIIQGSLETIPTITVKQREILITCARSFNEVIEAVKHQVITNPSGDSRLAPWSDFNLRGDTVALLEVFYL